ncbi:hypothetical protein DN752_17760 [Echinicola strongylocentroti]|uniref:Uncharacterized protein n=1 Tax=Echinicola strongylocentroti TaxID=1795355 RepID=A0A2Z4IMJ4_9BACT|nr:hypothetical protein [Echinicola strongylocentroti]AWW31828.1 hypothetical protein DN752_17760 [Echinicola strongylocentroti]
MINYTDYESYFLNLAKDYKPISHTEDSPRFAFMDIDEILSVAQTAMNMANPCMVLENPEGELEYINSNIRDTNYGAFMILQRVTIQNAEDKRLKMDNCKQIGMAIINQMFRHKVQLASGRGTGIPKMLSLFDLSQVKYNKVGPVFQNCYGWRFEINMAQGSQLQYVEDDWYSND